MEQLIEFIAANLVDQPDKISVTLHEEEDGPTLELRVAQEDLGKVIGKQGRTAKAMRMVLAAAMPEEEKRVRLEIVE